MLSCLPVVEEVFKPYNIFLTVFSHMHDIFCFEVFKPYQIFSTFFSHIYGISYFVDEFFEQHIVLSYIV